MKINRAVGLLLFIFLANLVIGDVVRAFAQSLIASLETIETAANTATVHLEHIR